MTIWENIPIFFVVPILKWNRLFLERSLRRFLDSKTFKWSLARDSCSRKWNCNGKRNLQVKLCSLSTAFSSSNQSMPSVPALLLSFDKLHIETMQKQSDYYVLFYFLCQNNQSFGSYFKGESAPHTTYWVWVSYEPSFFPLDSLSKCKACRP